MSRKPLPIPPGTVYAAGVIVRELPRNVRGDRVFVVRRACGCETTIARSNLYQRAAGCLACVLSSAEHRAHLDRARKMRNLPGLAARLRARNFAHGLGDDALAAGELFVEARYDLSEPEPCGVHDLDGLRRALNPDSLAHMGTMRGRWLGEAA